MQVPKLRIGEYKWEEQTMGVREEIDVEHQKI